MNIRTYSGRKNYIFISYSHQDSRRVLDVLKILDGENCRLWYDSGIQVGTNWPEMVASHLLYSSIVVFFISKEFIRSRYCQREVNYSVAENKTMICVYLEDVELSADMKMQLSKAVVIRAFDEDAQNIASKIRENISDDYISDDADDYAETFERKNRKNIWFIISIILAVVCFCAVTFIYGYFNNWFTKAGVATTVVSENGADIEINTFKDEVSMNVLLRSLSGDSLYICGNTIVSSGDAIRYKNGRFLINNETVDKGQLKTWEKDDRGLVYLTVCNEMIEDFSVLGGLDGLVYLDISGNPVHDLSFLSSLQNLQVLKIIDIDAADYSVIGTLGSLRYLYINENQLQDVKGAVDTGPIDIVVKE